MEINIETLYKLYSTLHCAQSNISNSIVTVYVGFINEVSLTLV